MLGVEQFLIDRIVILELNTILEAIGADDDDNLIVKLTEGDQAIARLRRPAGLPTEDMPNLMSAEFRVSKKETPE